MNSLTPMVKECERTLKSAIKHFKLNVPADSIVVTIQTKGRKRAVGWFWAKRWMNGSDQPIHELNLSAECLRTHDMGELLLHELAHAENSHNGIKDCSASQNHNKKFKAMAERLGLVVAERDKRFGYGFTHLGEGGSAFLEKVSFQRQLFAMNRLTPVAQQKKGSRMLKVACPDCGYTVRTTAKWLEVGLPTCCCGTEMKAAGSGEDGEDE